MLSVFQMHVAKQVTPQLVEADGLTLIHSIYMCQHFEAG